MPKLFKRIKFGLVPVTITPQMLSVKEQILISYIRTCASVSAQYDVEATSEVFSIAKEFIGRNFKLWLLANYMGGSGARAPLCKVIAGWVNGTLSGRVVVETVRRDIDRLQFLNGYQEQLNTTITANLDTERFKDNVNFDAIEDKHFFEMLALLGPELTAHFCLSLDGIKYK